MVSLSFHSIEWFRSLVQLIIFWLFHLRQVVSVQMSWQEFNGKAKTSNFLRRRTSTAGYKFQFGGRFVSISMLDPITWRVFRSMFSLVRSRPINRKETRKIVSSRTVQASRMKFWLKLDGDFKLFWPSCTWPLRSLRKLLLEENLIVHQFDALIRS